MEKERGRKGELILPIRGVNVVCRLYSTAIIPFRARCIGSMGRKFLRAEEDTTDLRVSYSIHAPGQLFLFRSDFRATLPLSFLVACTRIPEIRFYPEIGLENGACGKQFPVKTLNARVSSNFVNHTWRERERESEYLVGGIVDMGIVQIFKRRMFNSARYLAPHPCRSLQIGQRNVTS